MLPSSLLPLWTRHRLLSFLDSNGAHFGYPLTHPLQPHCPGIFYLWDIVNLAQFRDETDCESRVNTSSLPVQELEGTAGHSGALL